MSGHVSGSPAYYGPRPIDQAGETRTLTVASRTQGQVSAKVEEWMSQFSSLRYLGLESIRELPNSAMVTPEWLAVVRVEPRLPGR